MPGKGAGNALCRGQGLVIRLPGLEPQEMGVTRRKLTRLPHAWVDQRRVRGFMA